MVTAGYASPEARGQTTAAAEQPNIIYIVADDMRKDDLAYMPKTQKLIFDEGITYEDAFVTTSQCCPSRSSMLTGKYAHNTGVRSNEPPSGGASVFKKNGNQNSTVATWLHDAGYTTMLAGKYLNGFSGNAPPGWDEWHGYGSVRFGKGSNYTTDVIAQEAHYFIDENNGPFFVYLSPAAPHIPATPAARHKGLFPGARAPRPASFNEEDVSDKPGYIMSKGKADEKDIDALFRKRMRSLQSVDEMVEAIHKQLKDAGKLDNTYLIFTSDNGWMQGEHRLGSGKNAPYEPSIHMPLGIRGPGIPAGRKTQQITLNTDLAPTFAEIARASVPDGIDGRSLAPTLASDAPVWSRRFLEEYFGEENSVPPHASVRTDTQKYIEYKSGLTELYDLASDPDEINNLVIIQPGVDNSALANSLEDSCALGSSSALCQRY